jgi:hypothetical protein
MARRVEDPMLRPRRTAHNDQCPQENRELPSGCWVLVAALLAFVVSVIWALLTGNVRIGGYDHLL